MHVTIKKVMLKQKIKNTILNHTRRFAVLFVVTGLAVALVMPLARAQTHQNQINQLKSENADSHAHVNALRIRANDLQSAIDKLQDRINQLQAQIRENEAKSNALREEIRLAEIELARQKDVLGQSIRAMYTEGQISMIEMLATSKDLSQFVDKQQYREVVRDKIKSQVDKITALRLQLSQQREQIEQLIKEDKELEEEIGAQRAEQNRLLNLNQSEQAAFNSQIKENNKKINDLIQAQNALARRLAGGVFVSLGPVQQGEVIGTVGNTGFSDGAHLHLEARSSGGGLINPNSKLNGGGWTYPVTPVRVTQQYNVYNPVYISDRHPGIDFGGAGLPVKAVADGQIISRGCSADSSFFNRSNAYGYAVVIQHNDGTFSVYAHMIPPSSGYSHCNYSTY